MTDKMDIYDRVYQRDNCTCVYCNKNMGQSLRDFLLITVDHIVPRRAGGKTTEENLLTACSVCNRLKSDFMPAIEFSSETKANYINAVREEIQLRLQKWELYYESICMSKRINSAMAG